MRIGTCKGHPRKSVQHLVAKSLASFHRLPRRPLPLLQLLFMLHRRLLLPLALRQPSLSQSQMLSAYQIHKVFPVSSLPSLWNSVFHNFAAMFHHMLQYQ